MDSNLNKQPLVSVTICTYNRANFILKALKSIEEQTYKNIEVVIVDDASTDNTEEVIKNLVSPLNIKYYKNEKNLNIAGTRNRTFQNSSGEYIAILDSDDYWIDREKVEKQVEFLETNPDVALVGTNAKVIDLNDNILYTVENFSSDQDIKKNILIGNQFVHSSVMYRKSLLPKISPFDKYKSPFEDYDLILKLGRKYKLANLNFYSVAYLMHTGGESKKLNLKKKIIYLMILLKNTPYYPNFLKGMWERSSLYFK